MGKKNNQQGLYRVAYICYSEVEKATRSSSSTRGRRIYMTTIRALVVDHNAPGHLALHEVDAPSPAPSQALVRVAAVSLNAGEVRDLAHADATRTSACDRSEEHTSELQSPDHLVCRLLL